MSRLSTIPPGVTQWHDGDTKKAFYKNWSDKKSRELLIANGYDDKTVIDYEIDHYGLRNPPNVDISSSILTLGCSYTFGTGLNVDDTWPSQLGLILGKSIYNAGIPGSSNDAAFRVANYLIPKYKPSAIVLFSTFNTRYEFYDNDIPFEYSSTHYPIWVHDQIELASDMHNKLNTRKNILAIKCLCDENNARFVYMTVYNYNSPEGDLARDLAHAGKRSHKVVALEMKKLLGDY